MNLFFSVAMSLLAVATFSVEAANKRKAPAAGRQVGRPRRVPARPVLIRPEVVLGGQPRIDHDAEGYIVLNNYGRDHDCKIFPIGHSQWNWLDTDTHHHPGVKIEDFQSVLHYEGEDDQDERVDVVILTRGRRWVLEISPDLRRHLADEGYVVREHERGTDLEWECNDEFYTAIDADINSTPDKKPVVFILSTADAIRFYLAFKQAGYRVSALIHLTC